MPAAPPTPTIPCHAKRKPVLSRVRDCTGRAVRKQSCLFDVEALKTLTPSVRRAQAVLSY